MYRKGCIGRDVSEVVYRKECIGRDVSVGVYRKGCEVVIKLKIFREQKLFIEASDWEAKFYQIQSKYLLLLNELHNPQVYM